MRNINYCEMTYPQKVALRQAISSGLPFTDYWIEKTLTEVSPLIMNAESVNSMYISEVHVKLYLEKLIKNSFNQ